MGYREYVQNAIVEAVENDQLDDTEFDTLMDMCESAESSEDLEAVEEYLTEKQGVLSKAKDKYTTVRDNAAKNAGKRAFQKSIDNARKGGKIENNTDYMTANSKSDKASARVTTAFNAGSLAVGATALIGAVAAVGLGVRSALKKSGSADAKRILSQMKDLEKQAKDVAKRCKDGKITENEAKVEAKKIQAQMKKLEAESQKVAAADAKATKESVGTESESTNTELADIQSAIFESYEAGKISEEQRDELLAITEGTNIDQRKAGKKAATECKKAIADAKALQKQGDTKGAIDKLDVAISKMKEFKDEIIHYDDTVGDIIFGRILANWCRDIKAIAVGLVTFSVGSWVVEVKEIVNRIQGMIDIYNEEDFSLKMLNANKTRLVGIATSLIKKMENLKSSIKEDASKISPSEIKESVDDNIVDTQLSIFTACEAGDISEEDRDELLEMLED